MFYNYSFYSINLTRFFSTLTKKDWPIHWKHLTHQVFKKQQILHQLALRFGLQSFIVQRYQLQLLNSSNFKFVAVFNVLEFLSTQGFSSKKLFYSSSITIQDKLLAVQNLDKIEEYETILVHRLKIRGNSINFLAFECFQDLSFQMLFKLILDPVISIFSDQNSYGFQLGRSVHQALTNCGLWLSVLKHFNRKFTLLKGVTLEVLDQVNLNWFSKTLPIPTKFKNLFKIWLTSNLIDIKVPYCQVVGIPTIRTSGILSGLLLNFCLDGIERILQCSTNNFIKKIPGQKSSSINLPINFFIRYSQQILIGVHSSILVNFVKTWIFPRFFFTRGLVFELLLTPCNLLMGFNIAYLNYLFCLVWISSKNAMTIKLKLRKVNIQFFYKILAKSFQTSLYKSSYDLILRINTLLYWWYNYYCLGFSDSDYQSLQKYLHFLCWSWIRRKHPKLSKNAAVTYYFSCSSVPKTRWLFKGFKTDSVDQERQLTLKIIYLRIPYNSIYSSMHINLNQYSLPQFLLNLSAYSPFYFLLESYLYKQRLRRGFYFKN